MFGGWIERSSQRGTAGTCQSVMPKGSIDAVTSQHHAVTEHCYHGELSSEWTLTFTSDNK